MRIYLTADARARHAEVVRRNQISCAAELERYLTARPPARATA